ncbi:MMPL family transporter [Vibrio rumoiensis]|uniref:SSD domain-containing protein n=1 Tax=Vibrio rumoiensis 1S-45 TaxID=1188252 RepID=A0A1E5E205_9VIBR|nr:MMPL family transporter [Vibrio rumoiensis]OEF25445.1 hypothetical protein A1QC_08715 [Vibrio rumoiensis 1S-45]
MTENKPTKHSHITDTLSGKVLQHHKPFAWGWLVIMLALCCVLGYQLLARSMPIETNIMALLPKNQQDPRAQVAFDRVSSSISDKVIFLIGSPDKSTAIHAAQNFEHDLAQLDLFKQIDGKMDQSAQQAWGSFFYPYRFQLLTTQQQQRLQTTPETQTQFAVQSIYNPFSGVTGEELKNDPFLLFRDYLNQLTSSAGKFSLSDGYLTTEHQGEHYVLITADLNDSAYSLSLQNRLPQLDLLKKTTQTRYAKQDLKILNTGVIFYAAYGTQSAKNEISTIGVGSLIGIIILILLVYRSMMPLTLALLSISCGLIAAFVATVAIFGKVHLFSLVFGASLIGVSIDYAFHYLTDRLAAAHQWDAKLGLKHIFIAITLGLITSLIGYLGMLVAPFPGLQQLALFSSIGLFAAYASVVCWYPILAAKPSATIGNSKPLPYSPLITKWLALWQSRKVRFGVPVILVIAVALGLYHAQYNDDVRQLQAMPQQLKHQEQRIKTISDIQNDQQMLLVSANNESSLLEQLQQVDTLLDSAINDSVLSGYQSLSQYIPSRKQQEHNFQLSQSLYQSQGQALQQALQLKQRPAFSANFTPITIDDFLASPISKPVRFMWLGKIEGQPSAIITLNGVKDSQAIKQLVADYLPTDGTQISYLNKTEEISDLFGLYRQHVTWLLALATLLIYVVVAFRYGIKRGLLIVLPPIIAGGVGIAITALTGSPLNLFNLLALILVLGIGIDYTLFFAEQSFVSKSSLSIKPTENAQALHATLLAISLSALTTILSFGLLALSHTQAIHSFGLTVLFGIMVSWLLAPLAMLPSSSTKQVK